MNWINYQDKEPEHKSEVFVCIDRSIYFMSVYNHIEKRFPYFDINGPRDLMMKGNKNTVHYLVITKPE